MDFKFPLVTILGPTAAGKTAFAARLALELNGEIISADSRQVYKGMDIGTGKDLDDYKIGNRIISSHLIDIAEPGTEYNVFRFKRDFLEAWTAVSGKGKTPILCGGTGLYLESVLSGYKLDEVPTDDLLRDELSVMSDDELIIKLKELRPLHNTTDSMDRRRLLRAIEIEMHSFYVTDSQNGPDFRGSPVFGIRFGRTNLRERITARLTHRLQNGMIEEVQRLLDGGVTSEQLMFYGLEYKYLVLFIRGELNYSQLFTLLNTAIHQFAKRQMTWFRRMEKKGINIFWLEGEDGLDKNLSQAVSYLHYFVKKK